MHVCMPVKDVKSVASDLNKSYVRDGCKPRFLFHMVLSQCRCKHHLCVSECQTPRYASTLLKGEAIKLAIRLSPKDYTRSSTSCAYGCSSTLFV